MSVFMLSACAGYTAHDKHDTAPADQADTIIELSPAVKSLLTQEMRELQKGMKEIVPALIAGNWESIADIGKRMEKSYIMKDSLTEEQMHELHETLPASFQQLDHAFHAAAGKMAQAARQQDKEKVTFYYFRLTEACIDCHTGFATDKFPQFSKTRNTGGN